MPSARYTQTRWMRNAPYNRQPLAFLVEDAMRQRAEQEEGHFLYREITGLRSKFVPFAAGIRHRNAMAWPWTSLYDGCVAVSIGQSSSLIGEGKVWINVHDADDWHVTRPCVSYQEAREFMASLPSIIDIDWLRANGFVG